MRLNFSGVGEDEIREGIRRIGEVVREQVELYGTLTGAQVPRPARAGQQTPPAPLPTTLPAPDEELAKVLQLPRKRAG
jgi:2-aminoadipate transaminase